MAGRAGPGWEWVGVALIENLIVPRRCRQGDEATPIPTPETLYQQCTGVDPETSFEEGFCFSFAKEVGFPAYGRLGLGEGGTRTKCSPWIRA